jgi:hypothetical protein
MKEGMMHGRFSILILAGLMATTAAVHGQSRQAIIRIVPFTGTGISASELSTLERLVASHVVELKTFKIIDDAGRELALGETELALSLGGKVSSSLPLTADFIMTGHLGKIGDTFIFTLENTRVSTSEKLSVHDTAASINDIVLKTRGLTRSLFGQADDQARSTAASNPSSRTTAPAPASAPAGTPAQTTPTHPTITVSAQTVPTQFMVHPSISDLTGSWRGDKGLETVRILSNATGLAVLSGGGTMRIRIIIQEATIIISQDQPNDVAMYRGANITFEVARSIAAQARPMRWLFNLTVDGQTLEGIKESIAVSGTTDAISVDNAYERLATWTRISR